MAVSKVILNGTTLMDVTNDTVDTDKLLSGYTATKNDGTSITGSIETKTANDVTFNGYTVSVPSGFYGSNISKSMGTGSVTSGSANITSLLVTGNNGSNIVAVSGGANVSAPTVDYAGYISSSYGNKNVNTGGATVDATLPTLRGSISFSGSDSYTPTIARIPITAANITDAASGNATTSPTSGVYVAVNSQKSTHIIYSSIGITRQGYGFTNSPGDLIPTNSMNFTVNTSSTTYVPITTANPTFSGRSLTLNNNIQAGNCSISDSTNNSGVGISITQSYTISAVNYNSNVSGWVSKSSGDIALSESSGSKTPVYRYINSVDISDGKKFSVTMLARTTSSVDTTNKLSVTNNNYRFVDIGNTRYGRVDINNIGTVNVTSGSTSYGTVTISAKINSSSSNYTTKDVVINGLWKSTTVTSSGTYYGKVSVSSTTVSTSVANTGLSTYFDEGTSADNDVTITPRYSNSSSGFISTHSNTNNGGEEYYKIKTTSATVSGKTVSYGTGWITEGSSSVADGTITNNTTLPSGSTSSGTIDGGSYIKIGSGYYENDMYYMSGGTIPVSGTITNNTTLPSGSTSSGTISRGKYIKIGAGNYDNDMYYLAQANSGTKSITASGTTSVDGYKNVSVSAGTITNNTSGGTSSGTVNRGSQIKIGAGFYDADTYYTAQSNSGTKSITSSGTTSVDGYANVSVASASPTFTGGTIGDKSVSFNNSTRIITDNSDSYNNGLEISAQASATRSAVTYSANVSGYLTKSSGDTALSAGTADTWNSSSEYITGVELVAPSSGTSSFAITVPSGNSTVTFLYTVDTSGNVVITES